MSDETGSASPGGRKTRMVVHGLLGLLDATDAGEILPPADELARQYGVSMATLRSALATLRRDGLIETRHGVGSFVAKRRPGRGYGATGLLFFGPIRGLMSMDFAQQVLRGMLEEADACGRRVHMMPVGKRYPAAVRLADIQEFNLEEIDSIVSLEVFNRQLQSALASRMPTVSIDFDCRERGVSSCSLDHAASIRQLVEPLWLLGHRRIGLVGPVSHPTDPAHATRRDALLAELRARGVTPQQSWLIHSRGQQEASLAAEVFAQMPRHSRPTALISVIGAPSWSLMTNLLSHGLRIPQDVSVVAISVDQSSWVSWVRDAQAEQGPSEGPPTASTPDPLDESYAPLRSLVVAGLALPFSQMGRWAMQEAHRRSREPDSPPMHQTFMGRFLSGNTIAPPYSG
ncbi:MAG: hypothetical protein BIFFINMI_01535 [Phycisphaerae bacterium]|nr:hypothetical protein [Phycisphaerae bacterium]